MQLVQALEWCLELGVPCVSVYAFSLENFNRSPQEVDVLMDLAEHKLLAILQVLTPLPHTTSAIHMPCAHAAEHRMHDMQSSGGLHGATSGHLSHAAVRAHEHWHAVLSTRAEHGIMEQGSDDGRLEGRLLSSESGFLSRETSGTM